jgi:small GTP-binding protein
MPVSAQEDTEFWAALDAVRSAISQVERCSETERAALVEELDDLREMARKLRSGRVEIVVFGEISTGKSALVNALVGQPVASVSVRGGWTRDVWKLDWQGGYKLPGFDHSELVLVDTPGLNEVGGAERADMAREAAERADLILFVTDSDLNETEHQALSNLAACHKPIILVLNKIDLYKPSEIDELVELFKGPRLSGIVEPDNIVLTAADPREVEYIIEAADGTSRSEWRQPAPKIDDLKARILEVLAADGRALVALNASMYAADRSDRVAALRVRMRNDKANRVIWSYAVAKALAVSLNHAPLLDVAGGLAIDAAMVVTLGNVYGIELTFNNARQLATTIAKAAGWMMLSEAAVSIGSSLLKGLTIGASTAITAVPQATAAGYGSYIVGQAARFYFEHGASWGEKGAKTVIARILENTDKQSVVEHLRGEITKKLGINKHGKQTAK